MRELSNSGLTLEEVGIQLVSAFLHLTLLIYDRDTYPDLEWMQDTLRKFLGLPSSAINNIKLLDETVSLLIDGKGYKLQCNLESPILRELSVQSYLPSHIASKIKSNNISIEHDYDFSISYSDIPKSNVINILVAILHNTYNRAFLISNEIDTSQITTVGLIGPSKEYLNPFHLPRFSDIIIIDVYYLTPRMVYDLVKWLVSKTDSQIVLICKPRHLQLIASYQRYLDLSVESYLVTLNSTSQSSVSKKTD